MTGAHSSGLGSQRMAVQIALGNPLFYVFAVFAFLLTSWCSCFWLQCVGRCFYHQPSHVSLSLTAHRCRSLALRGTAHISLRDVACPAHSGLRKPVCSVLLSSWLWISSHRSITRTCFIYCGSCLSKFIPAIATRPLSPVRVQYFKLGLGFVLCRLYVLLRLLFLALFSFSLSFLLSFDKGVTCASLGGSVFYVCFPSVDSNLAGEYFMECQNVVWWHKQLQHAQ